MIERYFPCPRVQQRVWRNACHAMIEEYIAHLAARGYSPITIRGYVWAVEHFTAWLGSRKLTLQAVDKSVIRSFLKKHLPDCRCASPAPVGMRQVRPALNHLCRFLRSRFGQRRQRLSAEERLLEQYHQHLQTVAGLADDTCHQRLRHAREFLQGRFGCRGLNRKTLSADNVIEFVRGYAQQCTAQSAQGAANSLRSFLRYLHFRGRCTASLVAAVPRMPSWRLARVPKALTSDQLRSFLAIFDRSTPNGRRDYAMALCQVVLGLRVGEVAKLRLEDIDWRRGTIRIIAGKGLRERQLPLVDGVGKAIADYLRRGRPSGSCRSVFVRHRAPAGPVSIALVAGVYRLAFAKTKTCKGLLGTHILRHTAATDMLRHGANLKQIADVLGHQSIETTTIYAKVDLSTLSRVAMPWPEGRP
jgi:integrase/recombinase XerD